MKKNGEIFGCLIFAASGLVFAMAAHAQTQVVDFHNFKPDSLYQAWSAAKLVSGKTNFSVTASGYGSAYKYLERPAVTNNVLYENLQATVTLSAPEEADGQLGVLVNMIDADGSEFVYAWYGQHLGHLVLTMPVNSPTKTNTVGKVPGLNLKTLTHLHLQVDPGPFGASGAYTISWEELTLKCSSETEATTKPNPKPEDPGLISKEQTRYSKQ
jgi:hypothetical protein